MIPTAGLTETIRTCGIGGAGGGFGFSHAASSITSSARMRCMRFTVDGRSRRRGDGPIDLCLQVLQDGIRVERERPCPVVHDLRLGAAGAGGRSEASQLLDRPRLLRTD